MANGQAEFSKRPSLTFFFNFFPFLPQNGKDLGTICPHSAWTLNFLRLEKKCFAENQTLLITFYVILRTLQTVILFWSS